MLAICHTCYSMRAGVRSPRDWARAAAARGYSALAVADLNGLYGAVSFFREVEAVGLKPVIGATLHWAQEPMLIALALSAAGYRQLCRLLTARLTQRPFDLGHDAFADSDQLVFLSRSPRVLRALAGLVPAGNVFALSPAAGHRAELDLWDAIPAPVPPLPVPDAWLIDEDDRVTLRHLNALRQRGGERPVAAIDAAETILPCADDWHRTHPEQTAVSALCERFAFRFTFGKPLLPEIALPDARPAGAHLREICAAALCRVYHGALARPARVRLDLELEIIAAQGFADYFLYVREIVMFAQRRGIPVEVRGSAASSIVAYLLGFTHCCPLEHDLCFERFMNPARRDCPDIDVDIADSRRDEVIAYCYARWGDAHVAGLATIQTWRARGALRDAGRILRVPAADVRAFLEQGAPIPRQRELAACAQRLVGLPRHVGMHCGGLLITPCPLTDVTPLVRTAKGPLVSQYEKEQAEAIGLVKMDLLGNSGLSVIAAGERWLARRGLPFAATGPVYDFKVRRLFATGDTLGVYQCESPGMRQLCQALKPGTAKEVAAALSLMRPGPAAAGMKEAFIRRRRGLDPVRFAHPRLAEFLAATYGVMLYQEDVMKVAVAVAGYSMAEADVLRRMVSGKGDPVSLADERQRFVCERARPRGVAERDAADIWESVARFASYSFCKAHASVYGRLAWLTARLKAHHPLEFYAAVLNGHQSMYPKRVFVWDALRHGIPVWPPDINRSELEWVPTTTGLRAGLDLVKGLRHSLCRQIVIERQRRCFHDLNDLQRRVAFQGAELEHLILAGCCRELGARETLLAACATRDAHPGQLALFAGGAPLARLPAAVELELALTDIPFSAHPVRVDGNGLCAAREMRRHVGRHVDMIGILDAFKVTRAKGQGTVSARRAMSFATLEDESGLFEVVLFPERHEACAGQFQCGGPIRVRGVVRAHWDSLTLELHEAAGDG